uniref:Coiled-coil domain containing 138 n=1 Tax=Pipistrellus kuhlii TaxID=59472 RepID=A0A7J8A4T2_PIPKU|nr:coiled-coil domain containing 138 [Pipistrellus kuhlii]
MEPRVVKPPGQDLAVERLKSRYGLGGCRPAEYSVSSFDQAKCKRRYLTSPDDLDVCSSGDKIDSSLRSYSDERKHSTIPLYSSSKHFNMNWAKKMADEEHIRHCMLYEFQLGRKASEAAKTSVVLLVKMQLAPENASVGLRNFAREIFR